MSDRSGLIIISLIALLVIKEPLPFGRDQAGI